MTTILKEKERISRMTKRARSLESVGQDNTDCLASCQSKRKREGGTVILGDNSFLLGCNHSLLQKRVILAATLGDSDFNDPKGSSDSTSCHIPPVTSGRCRRFPEGIPTGEKLQVGCRARRAHGAF